MAPRLHGGRLRPCPSASCPPGVGMAKSSCSRAPRRTRALFLLALALERTAAITHLTPRALTAEQLRSLGTRGFCEATNWLPAAQVASLRADVMALDRAGLAEEARVGSAATERHDVRRTRVCHIIPPPPPCAGSVDVRLALCAAFEGLRVELDGARELSHLATLEPFQTELLYLLYPPTGFYVRHRDVPSAHGGWRMVGREVADGTALARSQVRRSISVLLYLNSGWDTAEWGGALRVYVGQPAGRGGGDDGRQPTATQDAGAEPQPSAAGRRARAAEACIDVSPEGGTLVLMHSALVEHEVLTTHRPRQAVVGWFSSVRPAPAAAWSAAAADQQTTMAEHH